MTTNDLEQDIRTTAAGWTFIRWVSTEDKTDHALKIRLHIMMDCFIQVYINAKKQLLSFTLVLGRARIFGRDCEGGQWHGILTATRTTTISARTECAPSPYRSSSWKLN